MRWLSGIATLALCAAPALAGNLTVGSGSSLDLGTGSLALGCADLDVLGTLTAGSVGFTQGRDVTITPSGVMNGNSATLQLSGDWDNTGSFVPGTSSVRITDGCGLLSGVVNGNSSFHNLELSSTSGKQVTFTAGTTQTVGAAFTVSGATGNLLKIRGPRRRPGQRCAARREHPDVRRLAEGPEHAGLAALADGPAAASAGSRAAARLVAPRRAPTSRRPLTR
jgi:hypothetical protein